MYITPLIYSMTQYDVMRCDTIKCYVHVTYVIKRYDTLVICYVALYVKNKARYNNIL